MIILLFLFCFRVFETVIFVAAGKSSPRARPTQDRAAPRRQDVSSLASGGLSGRYGGSVPSSRPGAFLFPQSLRTYLWGREW
jgi:hypothetical protein